MLSVAYQGEPGAWSEQAALDYFGVEAAPQPRFSFDDVFADVASGACEYGVVPMENSLGGSIHRNYDLLMRHDLHIVGEVIVRIHWCLIAHPDVQLAELTCVQSHPQALAQCERSITQLLPQVERKEVYDTAGSVKLLKESGERTTGALASQRAADIFGLPVLREGLEDDADVAVEDTHAVVIARHHDGPALVPFAALDQEAFDRQCALDGQVQARGPPFALAHGARPLTAAERRNLPRIAGKQAD